MEYSPHIIIVDDDEEIRNSLDSFFRSKNFIVHLFSDPEEFLLFKLPDEPVCLLLDIKLGQKNGLDLQDTINEAGLHIPVIIMSGHGTIPLSVRGIKAGAIDFFTKPFSHNTLLKSVHEALDLWKSQNKNIELQKRIKNKYSSLSEREKEVMILATSGLMNKQIADRLNLSLISIKTHRAHAMKKMGARSFSDLVHYADILEIRDPLITRYNS
ncbi:hypothetical protein HK11_00145 [Acetobacter sp. DmW_043]|uniref:response regulator transcription factor n=1 Tax=Acetobacter sp. DmW_043 TaxID=1670658 RepID=UPI000A3C0480|nr:response regulator [Acetobacter sp. DmW_043]OUI89437.1 hypothetical protein HK11_00145 [Acetobacter sp. DmW_043]